MISGELKRAELDDLFVHFTAGNRPCALRRKSIDGYLPAGNGTNGTVLFVNGIKLIVDTPVEEVARRIADPEGTIEVKFEHG